MTNGTLTIDGKRFVVIPEDEYTRLSAKAPAAASLPAFPAADADGHVPAVAYARVSLARKLIAGRQKAGWSQAELAMRAKVRPETINRIEHGKNTPDEKTVARIAGALKKVGVVV